MSIEVMKRIKSLLQDTKMIDSHTISAVVAECDAVILTQQPDNAACKSVQKRLEAQQPATGEPVAWSERDQLRHAQAAVVMPMIGPLLDAWENSDREVMSQEPELSKQLKNINSAMEDADTHPAPGVPVGWPTDAEIEMNIWPLLRLRGHEALTLHDCIAAIRAASPAQKGGE